MTAEQTEALKKELFKQIDKLPQRDAIEMSDAKQWVDYMAHVMPDQARWHIARAAGVGGSEVGVLVKNYLGHPADFMASAHDWAKSKLLQITPEPPTGALKRGHDIEPIHRKHFTSIYGLERATDEYNTLNRSHAHDRPWLRYSADDLVIAKTPTPIDVGEVQDLVEIEGLILIDYKCPTTVNTAGASFQYACQLHQGAIICEDNGIELSASILSQWDWQEWRPYNDLVVINPELKELIKQASDHYWGCVLRGEVPDYIYSKRYQLDQDKREQWTEAVNHLATLNALRSRIDRRSKEMREVVINGLELEQARLGTQRLEFKDALRISASTNIDEKKVREVLTEEEIAQVSVRETATRYDQRAILNYLRENEIDLKQFRIPTKLDPEKVFDMLADKGLNADSFIEEQLRFTTDRKLAAQADAWVEQNLPEPEIPEIEDFAVIATDDSAAVKEELEQAPQQRPRAKSA